MPPGEPREPADALRATRADGYREHVITATPPQAALTAAFSSAGLWFLTLSFTLAPPAGAPRWAVATTGAAISAGLTIVLHRAARHRFVGWGSAGVWTGDAAVPWAQVTDIVGVRRFGVRSVFLRLNQDAPRDPARTTLRLPPRWAASDEQLERFVSTLRAAHHRADG